MKELNAKNYNKKIRPIKIMQFGEGNFLRAFVEWILQDLNDKGAIDANVVVVQPMPIGRVADLARADGLYTLCLEGVDKGVKEQRRQIIDVLGDFINPYTQYDKFLEYSHSEDLETIISNTTEAGIALDKTDTDFSVCPKSFPGKLLALLLERYNYFDGNSNRGLAIVPCELIDNNGDTLKEVLIELAKINNLSEDFINWIDKCNHFTNTLVDRIVPGYPRDSAESICKETGYLDNNIVKAEVFHLWVLDKEKYIQKVLPADATHLNVIFADSIKPYKERKVKILNGAHTALVPIAYLMGIDYVKDAVENKDVNAFVRELINDEIKPTIDLPQEETNAFASSILERFSNPYIKHELMSIALNATTKFRTRLMPTYTDYLQKFGHSPLHILFSFTAMIMFYRGLRNEEKIALNDNVEYLDFWKGIWETSDTTKIATMTLSRIDLWDSNIATKDNVEFVAHYLNVMLSNGMTKALQEFLSK
ncbi:MAG: tagaturonate reductase [Clostridia bacterium]